ncbi:MAG: type II secretion system minor pseudopilin GspK [Arenimonas sp.]
MNARGRPIQAQRGAALLLVLWLLVLLIGVISLFALAARTEALQGRTLARGADARDAAEAGIDVAAYHLQGAGDSRWVPDGRANDFSFAGQKLQVRVVDESAKVDLNVAAPDLLVGLLQAVGVDPERARRLSGAIQDWRDGDDLLNAEGGAEDPQYAAAKLPYGAKDRPFETLSELRLVLGMDAALFEKLRPYVTVYSGLARPNPAFAGRPVLQALGLDAGQVEQALRQREPPPPGAPAAAAPPVAQGTGTYSISSRATRPDGTRVQVQAAIRIGGGGGFGQLYLPLSWRVGESD